MHTKDGHHSESLPTAGAQNNSHCDDGHYCPGEGGDIDGTMRTDSSDSSDSSSGVESWQCGEHSGCSPKGICSHGDNADAPECSKAKPFCATSLPYSTCRNGCSGDSHGCCHGDCGRDGHFGYHNDSGRSGAWNFGKVGNSSANCGAAPGEAWCGTAPGEAWCGGHNCGAAPGEAWCGAATGEAWCGAAPGEAWCGGVSCYDENSYLATKLKSGSSSLKDALNGNDRKSLFSELKDTIFSFLGLVDRTVEKLEHLDVLQGELYSSNQLMQLQKSRYGNLMEGYVKLEVQLKEVNEDYGQLLVVHDAQEKQEMGERKFNPQLHESSSQTESVTTVDVGSLCSPVSGSVCVQTEPCVAVEITHTAGDNSTDDAGGRRDRSSQSCSVVFTATGENGCETQGPEVATTLRNSEDRAGNYCGEAIVVQTECRISAGETRAMADHFPKESVRNVEPPRAPGSPLLRDQTSEHAREQNPRAVSVPTITWPCNHYKRLCMVKFDCCQEFYPCHRCHNEQADCGPKRTLKSIDARSLKCLACNEVQEITENSQNCSKCGIEFAKYFCPQCKHFTSMDETPYHCAKCKICRVRGHVSFHCDTCGVCLDVKLRDNHVCREGSAHDPCCICLEDAFSGCQILPCGHKVHKECAKAMIEKGVRRCPVCRQSFAHKLQSI